MGRGTVDERLVSYRQELGWSQKRLVAELRVDPTTLSRWELGKKEPCGIYKVRVEALLCARKPNPSLLCCLHTMTKRESLSELLPSKWKSSTAGD